MNVRLNTHVSARRLLPNGWDVIAFPLIIGLIAMMAIGLHQTLQPIVTLKMQAISLDPANLPEYALRTTLRMLVAMVAALAFSLVYGTLAAKSRRAEKVLVPILDILQSVPVLGYISFTVTFFIALFPGRVLEDSLSDSAAKETLDTVINWGRYGEIFSYNDQTAFFSLEDVEF